MPGDDYILGRDHLASIRLNLQHYLWRQAFDGHLLLPSVTNKHDQNIRIADVATGSGIWVMDMAIEAAPSVEIEGLDIDLGQCPPRARWPRNVQFRQFNLLKDPPDDFVERYDIINLRHVILVIKEDDPAIALKNLIKMLKPGGFLQWGEFDLEKGISEAETPGVQITETSFDAVYKALGETRHTAQPTWITKLDRHFEQQGLTNVAARMARVSPMLAFFTHDINIMVLDEAVSTLSKRPDSDQAKVANMRRLIENAKREKQEGIVWDYPRHQVIGQKPL